MTEFGFGTCQDPGTHCAILYMELLNFHYIWNYPMFLLCIYVVGETILGNESPSAGVQAEHYAGSRAIAVALRTFSYGFFLTGPFGDLQMDAHEALETLCRKTY